MFYTFPSDPIVKEIMKLKRSKLQSTDTDNSHNLDDRSESGLYSYSKIFLTVLIVLLLIIIFITCYRYIYGQFVYVCKRCLGWSNKGNNNVDQTCSTIRERERGSCRIKRRLLWQKTCPSRSMEKEKLLTPRDSKIVGSINVDLTKPLSLDMSCSSFSSSAQAKYKRLPNLRSNEWKSLENRKNRVNNISGIEDEKVDTRGNRFKYDKDICFSDTDLKYLMVPLCSRKSSAMNVNEKLFLYKWNSGNIVNSRKRCNVSSKLIELKLDNVNSINDNMCHYVSTSKSTCSPNCLLPSDRTSDSKYFSCNVPDDKSSTLPNIFLTKRSTNYYTSSTKSSTSNTVVITERETLNTKVGNGRGKMEKWKSLSSQVIGNNSTVNAKGIQKKIKSSVDVLRSSIEKDKNYQEISKSSGDFLARIITKVDNGRNLQVQSNLTPEAINANETILDSKRSDTEISQTYDELGALLSQYIKLQTQPCQRTYCMLKRHLRKRRPHSTTKCQNKLLQCRIYPYDMRPACNSGNVCTDAYDELKLTCASPNTRKTVYQSMFKRRKQFLNQPCIPSN